MYFIQQNYCFPSAQFFCVKSSSVISIILIHKWNILQFFNTVLSRNKTYFEVAYKHDSQQAQLLKNFFSKVFTSRPQKHKWQHQYYDNTSTSRLHTSMHTHTHMHTYTHTQNTILIQSLSQPCFNFINIAHKV